jgi:hypothetical protein
MIESENAPGEDKGSCESCRAVFPYRLIHNGFNDSSFAYCDRCGMLTLLSHYTAPRDLKLDFGPASAEMEDRLEPCACGGKFKANASPRCPECATELSPVRAAEWIERDAPGSAGGWRWARSWQGIYALWISGKLVSDNWQE